MADKMTLGTAVMRIKAAIRYGEFVALGNANPDATPFALIDVESLNVVLEALGELDCKESDKK